MADNRLVPGGIKDTSNDALNELIDRIGQIDLTPLLVYIIDNVDVSALPHLIEQFHVAGNEGGRLAENKTLKRALLKRAIDIHRMKGTLEGLRQALTEIGFGGKVTLYLMDQLDQDIYDRYGRLIFSWEEENLTIIERSGDIHYNGDVKYDGLYNYASIGGWAEYTLVVLRPITNDQAGLIQTFCREFAPARCHLRAINWTRAVLRYNAKANYDGIYNHGTA